MSEGSSPLWDAYKDLVTSTTNPKDLASTFGDSLSWSPPTVHTSNSDPTVTITTTDNTNGTIQITSPSYVPYQTGGTGTVWTPVPGTYEAVLESGPVELSAESKELLLRVEEKLDALLGKHPFARLANLRKALDEILAELNNDAQFEGVERRILRNGLTGWNAKYSYNTTSGRNYVSSGDMPTEIEAIAQLIRYAQGNSDER